MNDPTVLIGGHRYRLNYDGKMERYVESHEGRSVGRPWARVTERTEDAIRAAAALAVLHGSVRTMDGAGLDAAFYLATGVRPDKPVHVDGMALSGAVHLFAASSGGFPREVRAGIAPTVRQAAAAREAGLRASGDPRDIAKAKGLKLWNGGGYGVVNWEDVKAQGLREESGVRVYACAASRAELLRMIAAYQGLPGPKRLVVGFANLVKTHWSEGFWGRPMDRIEPEPGLWVQWKIGDTPVRVWPKEKAE